MTTRGLSAVDRGQRLCEELERIAHALITLDNQALLESEVALAEVVGSFASTPVHPEDRAAVEATVRRGRVALMRCLRLGASFTGVARARLSGHSQADVYNRGGAVADPSRPSLTVRATL